MDASDIQAFQPGLKGNKNAKTCLMMGDCSSSMDVCNALNFCTELPEINGHVGKNIWSTERLLTCLDIRLLFKLGFSNETRATCQ